MYFNLKKSAFLQSRNKTLILLASALLFLFFSLATSAASKDDKNTPDDQDKKSTSQNRDQLARGSNGLSNENGREQREKINWRDALSKVQLFFTTSGSNMFSPIVLPTNSLNSEFTRWALESGYDKSPYSSGSYLSEEIKTVLNDQRRSQDLPVDTRHSFGEPLTQLWQGKNEKVDYTFGNDLPSGFEKKDVDYLSSAFLNQNNTIIVGMVITDQGNSSGDDGEEGGDSRKKEKERHEAETSSPASEPNESYETPVASGDDGGSKDEADMEDGESEEDQINGLCFALDMLFRQEPEHSIRDLPQILKSGDYETVICLLIEKQWDLKIKKEVSQSLLYLVPGRKPYQHT
jgi:hypothetical protein